MAVNPIAMTEARIAESLGITEQELHQQALKSFLRDKKREVLQHRLDILARHNAESVEDLESRIAQGVVAEHPAWEDLIAVENLDMRLQDLDAYLVELENLASA
jgi:predicted transcriptional regulator